eukprot:scaffold102229_cov22-Tisochrysis_lutea.AAC.1
MMVFVCVAVQQGEDNVARHKFVADARKLFGEYKYMYACSKRGRAQEREKQPSLRNIRTSFAVYLQDRPKE